MLTNIINHLRNRDYMSGVERDRQRVKATGEVFTPTSLVQEMLQQLPEEVYIDNTKTFLDNSCGDGQFLSEVIIKKMEHGSTYVQALSTTYGVELMPDNCRECIRRLYMTDSVEELDENSVKSLDQQYKWGPGLVHVYWIDTPHYRGIANIVCADGLKYDYSFGKSSMSEPETLINRDGMILQIG
jgi:hypothetical protein